MVAHEALRRQCSHDLLGARSPEEDDSNETACASVLPRFGDPQKDRISYPAAAAAENTRDKRRRRKKAKKRGTPPPPSADGLLQQRRGEQGGGEVVSWVAAGGPPESPERRPGRA
jgi:hypothetical protein